MNRYEQASQSVEELRKLMAQDNAGEPQGATAPPGASAAPQEQAATNTEVEEVEEQVTVSKSSYAKLKEERDALMGRVAPTQRELQAAQNRLAELTQNDATLRAAELATRNDRDALRLQVEELSRSGKTQSARDKAKAFLEGVPEDRRYSVDEDTLSLLAEFVGQNTPAAAVAIDFDAEFNKRLSTRRDAEFRELLLDDEVGAPEIVTLGNSDEFQAWLATQPDHEKKLEAAFAQKDIRSIGAIQKVIKAFKGEQPVKTPPETPRGAAAMAAALDRRPDKPGSAAALLEQQKRLLSQGKREEAAKLTDQIRSLIAEEMKADSP